MERRVRYEVLPSEEEDMTDAGATASEIETVPLIPNSLATLPPPEVSSIEGLMEVQSPATTAWTDNEMSGAGKEPPVPPSYEMATSLPSYEEAELSKQEEMEKMQREEQAQPAQPSPPLWHGLGKIGDMELGSDGMFLCMFIIAFLFNWVGLMVSICMTRTIAGRFGAIAGFGLSMVKWVAIAKHNEWGSEMADGDSWLWWLLITLGFLIFFRGCTQYLRIKYQWAKINSQLRDRMQFLF